MRPLARVLIDESHRQAWTTRLDLAARMAPANPADASYAEAAEVLRRAGFEVEAHITGPIDAETLRAVDVLVLPHCSTDEWEATTGEGSPVYSTAEVGAIEAFVRAGGGLLVLAETEQSKYGNNLSEITTRFGIDVVTCTAQDPVHRFNDVSTWLLMAPSTARGTDVFAGVSGACVYRAGVLDVADDAYVFARTADTAMPAGAPVIAGWMLEKAASSSSPTRISPAMTPSVISIIVCSGSDSSRGQRLGAVPAGLRSSAVPSSSTLRGPISSMPSRRCVRSRRRMGPSAAMLPWPARASIGSSSTWSSSLHSCHIRRTISLRV